MDREIINDAFEYTLRMPENEQEAFATFCALNVIRAGMKKGFVSNKKGFGIIKSYVTRLATHFVEHPEKKLIDKMFVDTNCKPNCVIFVCMGVQFRYHSIAVNKPLASFCSSPQNLPITFDNIQKQPIAEGMSRLAKKILADNITDREWIILEVQKMSLTMGTERIILRPWSEDDAEVGYWLAKPYWNQGICTEALRLLVDYCFKEKGFQNLWGDFFEDNPASGRVMIKCGFCETGDISYCNHLYGANDRPVKIMKI